MKRPDDLTKRRWPLPTWATVTIGLLGLGVTALAFLFLVANQGRIANRARIVEMERRLSQLCAADDARAACQKIPPNVVVEIPSTPTVAPAPTTTTLATTATTHPATTATTRPVTTTAPTGRSPSSSTTTTTGFTTTTAAPTTTTTRVLPTLPRKLDTG